MDDLINILFLKSEEEINLIKKDQEKILQENKICLQDIINSINDVNIQYKLFKYEEQQSKINSIYDELFYKKGFKDALRLLD